MITPNLADLISNRSNTHLRPAAEEALEKLADLGLPESVIAFYRLYEPTECAEIADVRLWPIPEVLEENKNYVPGSDIFPHGFVVFATTVFGDAYCVDISSNDSAIALIAHDINFEKMGTDNIKALAKPIAPNLEIFLQGFADGALDLEPLYEP